MPNGPLTYAPPPPLPELVPPDVAAFGSPPPELPQPEIELPSAAVLPPQLDVDVVSGGVLPLGGPAVAPAPPEIAATQPELPVQRPPDVSQQDVSLAQGRQRVADVQSVRTGVAEQMQALNQTRVGLAQELQQPGLDPARQAEIVQELGNLQGQEQQLALTDQAAQRAGQVEMAGLQAETQATQAQAAQDLQRSYLDDADQRAELARAQLVERRAAREQATATAAERRAELQAKMREEAPTGAAQAALGLIGELLVARAQGRPPNFGVALQFADRARAQHQDEIEQLRAGVALADEDVDAQLAMDARIAADERAVEAAALAELDRELARIAAEAPDLPRGVAAQLARNDIQSRLAAADAQAIQAQQDADLKRREAEAKIAKTQAETRKLLREGRGAGVEVKATGAPDALAANVVTERGTQDVLVEYPDTSEGRKRAAAARTALADFTRRYEQLRRASDKVEQLDGKALTDFLALSRRKQYTELGVSIGLLQSQLAKQLAGGFSPSETDMATAKKMLEELDFTNAQVVGDTLNELSNITLDEWRQNSNRLGIPTAASERAIAASQRRTVSKKARRVQQLEQAEATLKDPTAPPDERIAAVRLMPERTRLGIERQRAGKEPESEQFVRLSTMRRLQNILATAKANDDDPDVIAAIAAELQKLKGEEQKEQAEAIERTDEQRERAAELREQADRQNIKPAFGGGRTF